MSNERWLTIAAASAALLGFTVLAIARHGASAPEVVIDYSVDGPGLNVDDPCFWTNPADTAESLLFVTTKDSGLVEVYKAATGAFVATIPGFVKPNNCAVDGDLLLTTDRTAPDVKVHHLPDLALARTFGGDMIQPQGIDVLHSGGQSLAYVTDSGDASVHVYDVTTGALVRTFATPGWGLGIEPVVVDDAYQRVFLSREEGNNAHGIGLFTPTGTLVKEFGAHLFPKDTEGLAIYQCGDGGYLIAADQQNNKSQFEVFDRVTLAHVGTFTMRDAAGDPTNSTDGIDILQTPLPGYPNGIFAACDGCGTNLPDEMDVVSWDKIAAALDLNVCPNKVAPDCVTTPCKERIVADADATISSVTPTTNAGGATDLQIDGSPVDQTLLRFDVPDLTGFDVLDATVRLTVDTQSGAGSAAGGSLFATSGGWDEATVTWDTRPAPLGSAIDTIGPVVAADAVDFDVHAALEEGAANDFLLVTTSSDRAIFRSREADNSPPALLLSLHASATPTLAITSPANGTVVPEGTALALHATATDLEDGDLGARVVWRSDKDGTLGTGAVVAVTLSAGTHVITAEVVDGARLTASDAITVSVNTGPEITITSPAAGASVSGGTPLTLTASAIDLEEGDLGAAITWTSSRDGALGTGASLNAVLSEGAHVLTASVADAGGAVGSAQRSVTVTAAPPTVTIDSPSDGAAFVAGEPVVLTATAIDFADGDLGAKVVWTSSLQGALGTGSTLATTALKLGTHVLTAKVVDASNLPAQASIQIRITAATASFTAVADAYVTNKSPTNNFGTASTLQTDTSPLTETFLRFALSGLAGLRVERAVLQLTVSTAAGSDSVAGGTLYAMSDNGWLESTVTYATRPPIDGPALGVLGAVAKSQVVEIDVKSAIAGDGTLTFALVPTSSDDAKYKSRESSSGRPKLLLTLRSASAVNAPPVVTILEPASGTAIPAGSPLTLRASAADFEDGDLASAVAWSSDLDGNLGTGSPLVVSTLTQGLHTLTARATDTTGKTGTATTTVVVTDVRSLALTPAADAYVSSDTPTKNFGKALVMNADSSPIRQVFLRFVVSGVGGRHVDAATLRLTTDAASSAASTKGGSLYAIADTGWTETALNYNSRPVITGVALATAGAVTSSQTVDFVVTPAVVGDGVVVFALQTTSSDGVSYLTREAGAGAPQLLLTLSAAAATPTPVVTPTPVATATPIATATVTATPVATVTATPVATVTATTTAIATVTATPVATVTATPAATATAAATATVTATTTPLPTATTTPIPTVTGTATVVATVTATPQPTATAQATTTATATALATPVPTQTANTTATATLAPTPTVTTTPTPVAASLTQLGTAIARVTVPTGSGSKTLATIRDGDKPAVGSTQNSRQYDTYDGANTATDEWMGYTYAETHTFERIVFEEGIHFWDGGWFETLGVQVRQNGVWVDVAGVTVAPAYPAANNGVWFETYTLRFAPIAGDGIRIDGRPGGDHDFVSVAELEVYGDAVAP